MRGLDRQGQRRERRRRIQAFSFWSEARAPLGRLSYFLLLANTIYFRPNGNGSTSNQGTYTTAGQMTATTFNASSDYRIKSNVQPIPDEYTIDNLRPVHYDMSGGEGHDMGFIAHEVQEIFPFLVSGVKDGENFQSMNYNGFIALLVKELQDLKKENNILKDRLSKIEERLGV
jgi:hypothetical protein